MKTPETSVVSGFSVRDGEGGSAVRECSEPLGEEWSGSGTCSSPTGAVKLRPERPKKVFGEMGAQCLLVVDMLEGNEMPLFVFSLKRGRGS